MHIPYEDAFPGGFLFDDQRCAHASRARVELANSGLWKKFEVHQTEMILTKGGRRMFPSLDLIVSDMDPNTSYCMLLEVVSADTCRYKFSAASGWTATGTEECQSGRRVYIHPQSPAKGSHWMGQRVVFDRVKLTNAASSRHTEQLVLTSMHKYLPVVHMVKTDDIRAVDWAPRQVYSFKETEFIAVTAYQNEKITQMKIDHNPFAKGFRQNGQAKCKRKRHSSSDLSGSDCAGTSPEAKKSHTPPLVPPPQQSGSSSMDSSPESAASQDRPSSSGTTASVSPPAPVLSPLRPICYHPHHHVSPYMPIIPHTIQPTYIYPHYLPPPPPYLPYGSPASFVHHPGPPPAVHPIRLPTVQEAEREEEEEEIDVVGEVPAAWRRPRTDFSIAAILASS